MSETIGTQNASTARLVYQDDRLLQYLLGLPFNQPPALSKECQELPNTPMRDVLFLSFDTENITARQVPLANHFQVGVSVLDTRDLQNIVSSWSLRSIHKDNLLRTHNYCFGPTKYCSRAARRFLFGQSETVHPDQIKEKIESLVANRDVVLVVCDGGNDLWLLDELKVKLKPVAIVDLQKAAYNVLQSQHRQSLNDLLVELDCPFDLLHTAGNDANFTLRALLMIAVRGFYGKSLSDSQQAILSATQAIAQSTGPDNWYEKRKGFLEEVKRYCAEREEINRPKKARKAARKAKLAAEGHWSSTKSGRQEFWARPENSYRCIGPVFDKYLTS